MIRVGVDIGGTFTDLQIFVEDQRCVYEYKIPTTPADPSIGLFNGLKGAAKLFGFNLDDVNLVLHGTTIATNAVLEDKLAKGGLLTTAGFEDILEIGRHLRNDVFALTAERRRLLIPRHLRLGIVERIGPDGSVVTALDESVARSQIAALKAQGVQALAVCLLNSFANPAHELRLRELIVEEAPEIKVSLSCDVCPEIREYERTATTALNALLMPVMRSYMTNLKTRLADEQLSTQVLLMQSNAGACSMETAARYPARLLLSGPSGGSLALQYLARTLDKPNLVGMDIGGTSCDVAMVRDGAAAMIMLGSVDGCSVQLPMTEIKTIGAGGGSIAWIDETGRLRVGPKSAGAVPGPVAYGQGGTEPTVTDANLVLGRMDAAQFMGGAVKLDLPAARATIVHAIGRKLGLEVETAAEGIITLLVASMVSAIRLALFEKGLDAKDFGLVSFGGAGGLHAALVAEELGVDCVIYPRSASTFSAFGFLWTDIVHNLSRSRHMLLGPEAAPALQSVFDALLAEGNALLAADAAAERRFDFALDLRYCGQGYELTVPIDGPQLDASVVARAVQAFHTRHLQQFSHDNRGEAIEVMTIRLTATGILAKPIITPEDSETRETLDLASRPVYLGGEWCPFPVYRRRRLEAGQQVQGPAIIDENYTSILIPAGWVLQVAPSGDLIARSNPGALPHAN